jgi:hypothetical protein
MANKANETSARAMSILAAFGATSSVAETKQAAKALECPSKAVGGVCLCISSDTDNISFKILRKCDSKNYEHLRRSNKGWA